VTLLERLGAIAGRRRADAPELALLLEALGAPTKAEQRRAAEVLAALASAGQDVLPLLEQGLADASARRRWGTAYACSLVGTTPSACRPVLLEALGSDDGDVRWAAATIIRSLPAHPTIVADLRALTRAPGPLQRKMALYCLRDLAVRAEGLEAEVMATLGDEDAAVRLAAMAALVVLAEDRVAAARAVVARLDDRDAGVRRAAAAALGRLGPPEPAIVEALRSARSGADRALARAAARSLTMLGASDASRR
jgi:hypothetical protein